MLTNLRALWTSEPVRVATIAAAIVVFALAKADVVVDQADVLEALLLALPLILGGEAARRRVTPYAGEPGVPSDEQLDVE